MPPLPAKLGYPRPTCLRAASNLEQTTANCYYDRVENALSRLCVSLADVAQLAEQQFCKL